MKYISRNMLIESILNEDVGLDFSAGPRKRANLVTDTNAKDSTDKVKVSKGGQSKKGLAGSQLIFRLPTKAEFIAVADKFNVNLGSDAQMNQIRVLSKVLFDFGILEKIYKSKKDDWNIGKTNSTKVNKLIDNVRRICKKNYSPDTPIEQVAEDLESSTSALQERLGANIPEVIGAIDNWAMILQLDPRTKSAEFPRGFNPILMKNIEGTADGDYKEVYRNVMEHLIDIASQYKNPKAYAKFVTKNQTMAAVFNEPLIKRAIQEAFSSNKVKDVEELELYLQKYLESKRVEPNYGNTMTIIHHKAMESIKYTDLQMKRHGYEDGIRNFNEMIDYVEEYHPDTYDHLLRTYHISGDELRSFGSYSDFCDWLFGDPDRLYSILQSIGSKTGSRIKGELQRGFDLAVRRRDILKKENSLADKMNSPNKKRGIKSRTADEINEEIAKLTKIIEELDKDIKERKAAKQDKEDPEFVKVRKLKFDAGKRRAALVHTLKKRDPNKESSREASIEDRYAELGKEREALEDRAFDRLKDDAEIEQFNREYNRTKTRDSLGANDIGSGYRTMAFSLKLKHDEQDVIDYIVNSVDKYLNKQELDAGKEDLINVDYETGRYNGGMRTYPCVRIIIDYPESSALFRKLKSQKDKSERIKIVASIIEKVIRGVHKQFGFNVDVVANDPEHKIAIMTKNEVSYSFR